LKFCGLTLDCVHDIEILYLKSFKVRTVFLDGHYLVLERKPRSDTVLSHAPLITTGKSQMITDTTFFTNEPGYALLDRFIKTLKHVKYFDVLVGYFKKYKQSVLSIKNTSILMLTNYGIFYRVL